MSLRMYHLCKFHSLHTTGTWVQWKEGSGEEYIGVELFEESSYPVT
jgi:hypothetical protein